jgi:hypothetical protein
MNYQSNSINSTNSTKSTNKFGEITDEKEIQKMKKLLVELKTKQQKESKFKVSDITAPGGKFDTKAFNKQVNKVQDIIRQRRKLKDKIKLANLAYRPLDYNQMTIGELKMALYSDTYDMFREISNLKSFSFIKLNEILSKNYRKLTILIILLVALITTYLLVNYLDKK